MKTKQKQPLNQRNQPTECLPGQKKKKDKHAGDRREGTLVGRQADESRIYGIWHYRSGLQDKVTNTTQLLLHTGDNKTYKK